MKRLNIHTLQKLYLTKIRRILEYGCILFDNCTPSESSALENLQQDAAGVSVGAFWKTNREQLLHYKLAGPNLVVADNTINWCYFINWRCFITTADLHSNGLKSAQNVIVVFKKRPHLIIS